MLARPLSCYRRHLSHLALVRCIRLSYPLLFHRAMSTVSSAAPIIEIEKKYKYTEGIEQVRSLHQRSQPCCMLFLSPPAQRVRELDGCSFVDEVMMSDVYYDNNAYSLSMMDHWLRSRDDIWELKRPTLNGHTPGSPATTYEELTDEAAIIAALTPSLLTPNSNNTEPPPPDTPLSTAISAFNLSPFVHILTTRRTFIYSHTTPPFSIVLDHATPGPLCHTAGQGWQYAVVEVEAVVNRERQQADDGVVKEMEGKIDEVAERLELVAAGEFGGKVSTYLKRFNPELLARLLQQSKQGR